MGRKIILLILSGLFTTTALFAQTEALKVVVNNLAYYRQRGELRYLSNAKKSVDSLIRTRSDSSNLNKNVYKAIVYSSIAYIDSTNKLGQPENFVGQTVQLVDRLSEHSRIYKFQPELDYAKRCLANALIRQGFTQTKQNDFITAVQSFEKAQLYAPQFKQVNVYLAFANTQAGRLPEAIKYYQTLLTADSVKAEYVTAASKIYKTLRDTGKALDVLQKGRKLLPADKGLLLEEAKIYNNKKDYKALEPLLKDLISGYPNNADVQFIAASCYDYLKQYDRAESLYLRAIEINNAAYNPIYNLALLYLKQSASNKNKAVAEKNLSRSAIWLQKAYEMKSNDVNTLKLLQLIYAKNGNDEQLNEINIKLQELTN